MNEISLSTDTCKYLVTHEFVVCGVRHTVSSIEQSLFALVLSFNFIFQFILENFKCFFVKYTFCVWGWANGKNLVEPTKLSSFKLKYIQIMCLSLAFIE